MNAKKTNPTELLDSEPQSGVSADQSAENSAPLVRSAVIVDQLELVRLGLCEALRDCSYRVVASVTTLSEGIRTLSEVSAEMLIVGNHADLKRRSALKATKRTFPGLKIIVLVDHADLPDIAKLIDSGVDALVLRNITADELRETLERIDAGERVVAPALAVGAIGRVGPLASAAGLSARELEVLAELATGASYRDIAESLIVTQATVKTHLVHIYDKLGVRNRQEAVARALELGLLG